MAVEFISTEGWSHDKWLGYRKNGVGASDFSVLLGLNKWRCSLAYFHQLIGVKPMDNAMNFAQINGKKQEPIIADYYRYFEKDHATMVDNINKGEIVREVEEVNAYCVNSKYPLMFASLDRKFKDKRFGDNYCALEIKNESFASHAMWENMNPNQVLQLAFQLLVSEYPFGVLVAKVGDNEIVASEMTYKQAKSMEKTIVATVNDFWNRVEKCRVLMNQIYHAKSEYNMQVALSLQQEIFKLEPPPQETDAYLQYVSSIYKQKTQSVPIKGDIVALEKAKQLQKITAKRKKLEIEETKLKTYFVDILYQSEKTELDFGRDGSLSLYNGRFTNRVK